MTTRADLSELIARHEANGGEIRQFRQGDSAEYIHIQTFLASRGYVLSFGGRARVYVLRQVGQREGPKKMSWADVLTFVDKIRVSEGFPALKRMLRNAEVKRHF